MYPENTSFSSAQPTLQIHWDGTSLSNLKTCAFKYYLSNVMGYQPRKTSIHLVFGLVFHEACEHYHKLRANGKTYEEALEAVLMETYYRQLLTEEEVQRGGGYHEDCLPVGEPTKTPHTLLRSIVWYLDQFGEDNVKTFILSNGKPAVELSFTFPLFDEYTYCGHFDRIAVYNDQLYVTDYKAQPLYSNILTPKGWDKVKNIKVGDLIATKTGNFVKVKSLHPKGVTEVYAVRFNDGTAAHCAKDHLWTVATDQKPNQWNTVTLEKMISAPKYVKFHVPLVEPIQFEKQVLPLHPYLLGALLGDGYLAGNSIQLSKKSEEKAHHILSFIPEKDKYKKASEYNHSWTISGGHTLAAIKKLELFGSKSRTKFIPHIYMIADEKQRRELLQGLLDTDGGKYKRDRFYDSLSVDLIKDVCALVRSLGGNARYRHATAGGYRASLRMSEWEMGVGKHYIQEIERVKDSETVCIEVDSPDGLYVTNNYIVTHNTTKGQLNANYFQQFSPNIQMTGYTLASQIVFDAPAKGVIIDAIQLAVTSTQFARQTVHRTASQLEEFLCDLKTDLAIAKLYSDTENWPLNPTACHFYGGCQFRRVCSHAPSVRPNFLKADFVERHWDPARSR